MATAMHTTKLSTTKQRAPAGCGTLVGDSDGDNSDSDHSDGDNSDSDHSDGDHSDGDHSDGDHSDGDHSDGDNSDGDNSDGDSDNTAAAASVDTGQQWQWQWPQQLSHHSATEQGSSAGSGTAPAAATRPQQQQAVMVTAHHPALDAAQGKAWQTAAAHLPVPPAPPCSCQLTLALTLAPCLAITLPQAKPMPFAPPVMIATRSASRSAIASVQGARAECSDNQRAWRRRHVRGACSPVSAPAPLPTARTPEVQEMSSPTPQLEVKARVVAVRKCPDSSSYPAVQQFVDVCRKQGVWGSLASITVDSAAGNIGRISGLAVSINALRRQQGLALIIFWPCVSHQIHNALHKAMTTWGKAEGWGRQGLQAQLALSIEQLCSLTKKHWDLLGLSVQHCAQPSEPSQSRWGSYVDACSSLTRVLKPVTAAVTGIMERQGKAAPAWAGDLCSLLLDTDLICMHRHRSQGGMHAFELARHVEQLLDNLLDASTQDAEERFPYIFKHAQGLFVATTPSSHTAAGSLPTAAASAPNPLALEGPQQWAAAKPKLVVLINKHIQALYEYLYEHSQLFFQLPHLLAAMGSSSALYAQKAAEQVLKQRDTRLQEWDVHQRQKQQQQQGGRRQAPSGQQFLPFDPAVFDPYATLEDFLDDIRELAAGQPCSLGLRTHLVEFFGAAPSSNHAVESSLQHTKHGNSAKQGLDAMIGSINNKLDPGALANIDLADFEARLLTLRKQKRDKETTSADDNREAKAARKTEESACMVDGNAKMVLNVPTQVPLQQLQQAFQQHARGADYSNTSAKEATRFTREQLRAYLLYHKVPPRDQPVGNTLVAGWQKAVQKHIAERGSPTDKRPGLAMECTDLALPWATQRRLRTYANALATTNKAHNRGNEQKRLKYEESRGQFDYQAT
ncbi:hypothetical protein QJQ45_002945 [Haematococcus lacustris]|nr:hypothetical protein QJQ45_002945 [Haematococcus lacustris]